MRQNKKAVLAFSGGLDTSFSLLWLKEKGYEVVTVTVDTGGFEKEELEVIGEKAMKLGVAKHFTVEAASEFYKKIVSYVIRGNLLRGSVYPLCVGPERIIQAAKVVEIARNEKADFIAHGSTGAGNDQVRFDTAIKVLAPEMKIITPIRELSITRDDEAKFLEKHGIKVDKTPKSYSVNRGILGTTTGGNETKNSWEAPPDNVYPVQPIEKTPDKPVELVIEFKNGLPQGLEQVINNKEQKTNYKKLSGLKILQQLNEIGAEYGIGKGIHLGTTILGIKGRVAFTASGISILIKAHQELEKLVLTGKELFWKEILCQAYGNMLHEAMYFDAVMRDIESFINSSQKRVAGLVRMKLFKGNIFVEGLKSDFSLMNKKVATYGEENNLWTGEEAAGFSKIYGLEAMLWNLTAKKRG